MELTDLLNAGAIAGLLAGIFNSVLAPVFAPLRRAHPTLWFTPAGQTSLLTLLLYLLVGVGLALLFWLSWGLAALVGVPWWYRGLAFALAIWVGICLPFVSSMLLTQRWHWSAALVILIEWLNLLVAVGLACAWRWAERRL